MRRARDGAHDDVVESEAKGLLLLAHLFGEADVLSTCERSTNVSGMPNRLLIGEKTSAVERSRRKPAAE
jgi:hypothetical protein